MIVGVVEVADCERVQTNWFRVRATRLGGTVWEDDGLLWTDGPDGMNLMFPSAPKLTAVRRGVDRARDLGRGIVGAWLGLDADASALAEAGFERGWAPWWMTADLDDVPPAGDPRVGLRPDGPDDRYDHDLFGDLLEVVRREPARVWYAGARGLESGRPAGHAWSFRDGDLAGVFDMQVWPPFRRQGMGTALLAAVCSAARLAGARHAVLNATPEGKLLYDTCGFTQIGEGITWWHHLGHG